MELTTQHLCGALAALILVFGLGVYSGRRVRSSSDFSVCSRSAGAPLVTGTLMGTMIGGGSTIGTAQLAFMYGFSAWWFTLGCGLACLLIALFFVKPMRETAVETVPQFLANSYGPAAGVWAALFLSVGMFLNIVPQVISSIALLSSLFPLAPALAALAAAALMACYVIFGGLWGAGLMGMGKVILSSLGLLAGGGLALHLLGGIKGMTAAFPPFPWFSLFGQGVGTDLAAAMSMLVGILSSQIYFQAIFCGRSVRAARTGALISAVLCPTIGFGGILVGMFMRANFPHISPAQALPLFIVRYLPPWPAGVVLLTLLLASVGCGAGLTLGVSTMLNRDIVQKLLPRSDDRRQLLVFRLLIVFVLVLALVVIYFSGSDQVILQWSYLSQGLRGATVSFPLLAVIFLKGRVNPAAGKWAVLLGPAAVIAGSLLSLPFNPLYLGLAISLAVTIAGQITSKSKKVEVGS